MTPINGIVRNGKIEIKAPAGFSEGTEVRIWLDMTQCDDDGPMSPEEIEQTLEAMSQVQPFVLTDADRIEWQKALDDQKALEINTSESRTAKTMGHWE